MDVEKAIDSIPDDVTKEEFSSILFEAIMHLEDHKLLFKNDREKMLRWFSRLEEFFFDLLFLKNKYTETEILGMLSETAEYNQLLNAKVTFHSTYIHIENDSPFFDSASGRSRGGLMVFREFAGRVVPVIFSARKELTKDEDRLVLLAKKIKENSNRLDPSFVSEFLVDKDSEEYQSTVAHEVGHVGNYLLYVAINGTAALNDYFSAKIRLAVSLLINKEIDENTIKDIRSIKEFMLEQAKDEFLVRKKAENQETEEIYKLLRFDKTAWSLPVYFYIPEEIASLINSGKNDKLNQKIVSALVGEYEKQLEIAFKAFDELIKKGGYTNEEAVALLSLKKLKDWHKTVRRLLSE